MRFESVHNYYEQLVYQEILGSLKLNEFTADEIEDIACIALNHLPPRYIRHRVDFTFYLSPIEQAEIFSKVKNAVTTAVQKVSVKK
ncbi:MAG: late competence development ComFB family protein [Gammaproteobacteria bacterium]|nr:late competence development ComFB family protein [Gammaproteobacteria bacterium]